MRHVVLGAHTPIGSSIVRLLVSIGTKKILAVTPDGSIPEGVNPRKIKTTNADIIDVYSLYDLFLEGDIVYNTQISFKEALDRENADTYHVIGLINLLGMASQVKVGQIIHMLPMNTGTKVMGDSKHVIQDNPTPYQASLKEAYQIIQKYWNELSYGWDASTIQRFTTQIEDGEDSEDLEIETGDQPSGPSIKTGRPSLNLKSSPSSGPSISTENAKSSSGPSLGPKLTPVSGPKLVDTAKQEVEDEGEDESNESETTPTEEEDQIEEEDVALTLEFVPLKLLRFGRLFGPLEENITEFVCRSIRLQRMKIVGRLNKQITWSNPIDVARGMVLFANTKARKNEYFISSFTASGIEIIKAFDEYNHSKTRIIRRPIIIERINYEISKLLEKVGIEHPNRYFPFSILNYEQRFNDEAAIKDLNWEARYDLDTTVKEAMNWFINHLL